MAVSAQIIKAITRYIITYEQQHKKTLKFFDISDENNWEASKHIEKNMRLSSEFLPNLPTHQIKRLILLNIDFIAFLESEKWI